MAEPLACSSTRIVSDNVVPVKHFLSVLTRALRRARHFALVEGSAIPTQGPLVIVSGQETRSDPSISSVTTSIMITTAALLFIFSLLTATTGSQDSASPQPYNVAEAYKIYS